MDSAFSLSDAASIYFSSLRLFRVRANGGERRSSLLFSVFVCCCVLLVGCQQAPTAGQQEGGEAEPTGAAQESALALPQQVGGLDTLIFAEALQRCGELPDTTRIKSFLTVTQSCIGGEKDSLAFTKLSQASKLQQTARKVFEGFGASVPPLVRAEYADFLIFLSETFEQSGLQERRKAVLTEILSNYPEQYVADNSVILARIYLVGQPASPDTSKSCHRGPELRETKLPIALAMSGLVSLAPNHADGDLMYRYLPASPLALKARRILAKSHAALGDYRAAYVNQAQVEELEQGLDQKGASNALLATYLSYQFEKEKEVLALQQAQERQVSAACIARQRLLLGVGGLGLLLLGGLAFTFYRNFRFKQRAADALAGINATLVSEQENLRRANKKLQQFSGVVAHDILSNVDLMLSSGQLLVAHDAENKRVLANYYATTQKVLRLLKDYCKELLREARSEKETPQLAEGEANAILQAVLEQFSLPLQQQGFTVAHTSLVGLRLPAVVVRQLFFNVLTNALKYVAPATPQPVLRIGTFHGEDGLPQWHLEDNGLGIPAARRPLLLNGDSRLAETSNEPGLPPGQRIGLSELRAQLKHYGYALQLEDSTLGGLRVVIREERSKTKASVGSLHAVEASGREAGALG